MNWKKTIKATALVLLLALSMTAAGAEAPAHGANLYAAGALFGAAMGTPVVAGAATGSAEGVGGSADGHDQRSAASGATAHGENGDPSANAAVDTATGGGETDAAQPASAGSPSASSDSAASDDSAEAQAALSEGARGEAVEQLQARLIELGYLSGAADGIFGAQTQSAVALFQSLNGLDVTGVADARTTARMSDADVRALRAQLSRGNEGDAVAELQRMLIQYGFLRDAADGIYGENTQSAVAAFQAHLIAQGYGDRLPGGIDADGVASPMTQEILFSDGYSTYLTALRAGDSGSEARRVERRLRDLGYLDADPDEVYDDYAAACTRAFQQAAGLDATGVADRATIDALFAADAATAERFVAHDIALGDENGAVRSVQRLLNQYGMLADVEDGEYGSKVREGVERLYAYLSDHDSPYAELFADSEHLSAEAQDALAEADLFIYREDVGPDASEAETARVQRRLHTLYYLSRFDIDGIYGVTTRDAIALFQEKNGLEATGIADEETQRALFSADPVGDWTHYKLEISLDDQYVYVYELNADGAYEQIDAFICSTGLGSSTPRGIFTQTQPLDRWHYFTKFECWAQYAYQIEGDILFHSVLYSERDTSTLRVNSVYALGSKASHGCVRLQVEDAKWIYENCPSGTVVVVY